MIPSGLQALMEASAVLQQQASQTAPGPQGQQPTVASQVMQQAQQVAQPPQMPQVQDIGRQAGLAAQLMAQRQQQQQQTAQNPEAIAQMAAQMLQQKGVASLPANMQFRDGGIIGYAGPDGSVVANPVADRELAPMGGRASSEEVDLMTVEEFREYERSGRIPERVRHELYLQRQREVPVSPEEFTPPAEIKGGLPQILERAQPRPPRVGGSARASEIERMTPEQFRTYEETGEIPASVAPPTPIEPSKTISEGMDASDVSIGRVKSGPSLPSRTSAGMDASDASLGGTKPAGIAAALPPTQPVAQPSARPDYAKILEETPESAESIARRAELDKLRKERLNIAKGQEDLSARGIEALGRAKKDRDQLLESARSRDTYERLNALFMSMRSLGNEVGNTQRAIQAREEAAVSANLLHEESVLKLKQAQQARELGMKDQEIQLIQAAQADEQKAQELRRADAKIKAELAKSAYEVDTREMTHARDRANATALKLAELKQQAQRAEDDRETRRIIGLQTRLTSAQDSLTRARAQVDQQVKNSEAYKAIQPLEQMKSMGTKLTPEQEKQLSDFKAARARLEESTLQRFYTQLDSISKELGLESPVPASQSTGNAIDFSKLPTK